MGFLSPDPVMGIEERTRTPRIKYGIPEAFPTEWVKYITEGEDPRLKNPAYYRNAALSQLYQGFHPTNADGFSPNSSLHNPWQKIWNTWVTKGGQDPTELATIYNELFGGELDAAAIEKMGQRQRPVPGFNKGRHWDKRFEREYHAPAGMMSPTVAPIPATTGPTVGDSSSWKAQTMLTP